MIAPEIQNLISEMTKECERLTMEDVQVYDVQGKSPLTDVVFIATATHELQLDAARRSLSFMAKQAGFPVQNPTEDYSEGWLVLDCVDLVVHILVQEKRAFYDLDGLMDSVKNMREEYNDQDQDIDEDERDFDEAEELTQEELEEILSQMTPEEAEAFLATLESMYDDEE